MKAYLLVDNDENIKDALILVEEASREEIQAAINEAGELWEKEGYDYKIEYVKRFLDARFNDVTFIDFRDLERVEY